MSFNLSNDRNDLYASDAAFSKFFDLIRIHMS